MIIVKVLAVHSTFVPIMPMYEKKFQAGLESDLTLWMRLVRGEFHETGKFISISFIESESKSSRV